MNKFTDTKLNLEILGEEAGEIIEILARIVRMKSKIVRFGLKDYHPKNFRTNVAALEKEIGHFQTMTNILITQETLSKDNIEYHSAKKHKSLGDYYTPMGNVKIETLTCGLCGKSTQGRQWHKSQEGYGICPSCYSWLAKTCTDWEHLRECYGAYGYHHNIKEGV